MGILEWLGFGGKRLVEPELLEALLRARQQGDMRRLAKLCRSHTDVIAAAIPRWKKPPEQITKDPATLDNYFQTLGTAADLLRQSGHPELWNALVGNPADNPITIWERKLKEAQALAEDLRYDEAAELLANHLVDTRRHRGSAVDRLQALSQGTLGHVRYNAGKVELAIGHCEQALRMCREQNDQKGVRVYLEALYNTHRYMGRTDVAADHAQQLGQAWGAAGETERARRFAKISDIVRAGEPLVRVVALCDGKTLELDEVEIRPSMRLELHFWRNRPTLLGASRRVEQGKKLAGQQQYDAALELFREAAKVDQYDPDPHYQAGMVLCEQQRYTQAVEEYELCESLAPGWYFCRSDLWNAQQLAMGAMPHEVFLGLRLLQDGPRDGEESREVAKLMQPRACGIPLFGLLQGELLQEAGRTDAAKEVWQNALKNDPDPDVRTRLLQALSLVEEDKVRQQQLLEEAAGLNGNLIAGAGAMLALRSHGWS